MKSETAAREEKTKRLRAARLAKEAKEALLPVPAGKKPRNRSG